MDDGAGEAALVAAGTVGDGGGSHDGAGAATMAASGDITSVREHIAALAAGGDITALAQPLRGAAASPLVGAGGVEGNRGEPLLPVGPDTWVGIHESLPGGGAQGG